MLRFPRTLAPVLFVPLGFLGRLVLGLVSHRAVEHAAVLDVVQFFSGLVRTDRRSRRKWRLV